MARLTKEVRKRLLEQNDGFTRSTHYKDRNFQEQRIYKISGGQLHIKSTGKTSWADSRFDDEYTARDEEVHRFLYKYLDELNKDGID